MIHYFPEGTTISVPERFNDPFRYIPHPSVIKAADILIGKIRDSEWLTTIFSEGKMLGVLVVEDQDHNYGFLCAFSGNAGNASQIEGFVPPIYDLMNPDGHFKKCEAEISILNKQIDKITASDEFRSARLELTSAEAEMKEEIESQKSRMAILKAQRDLMRCELDSGNEASLIQESQFEKAELKRIKDRWKVRICQIKERIIRYEETIACLKRERREMSDKLQEWIFSQYIVHNAKGQTSTISDIFRSEGMTPPAGTGECAAPKLLEAAYRNGFRPVAMGEFWYGESPASAVRTQGRFYPSCTSKCGPLLSYMLDGIEYKENEMPSEDSPAIIYEDPSIVIASKESGVPSVPGLDGRISLQEMLSKKTGTDIYPVHRLDMDTSGIIIFAKTSAAESELRRQFEEHSIRKTYTALLSHDSSSRILYPGEKGTIDLPLNGDYDERPRQKVDPIQGKTALTSYTVQAIRDDLSVEVALYPVTGRTHQLRVHSAHISGLGRPIKGDRLYGGDPHPRLCLHAQSITFRHPDTGEEMTFTTETHKY